MAGALARRTGRGAIVCSAAALAALVLAPAGQGSPAAAVGRPTATEQVASPLAGILPPKNPPKNLAPNPYFYRFCAGGALDDTVACNAKVLLAIDHARATEPLGPLRFDLQKFLRLNVADQLFVIANLERVSRGEPPVSALTTQLDRVAKAGAVADRDPELSVSRLSGGAEMFGWGSNWAEGTESALGADDVWMYDDGFGSANFDCRSVHAAGCWGHRDNVLRAWQRYLVGCPAANQRLVMGAGYSRSSHFGPSFAEIFVVACGPKPTGEVFTWAEAQAAVAISHP
jgi:hypothetical protein